MSVFPGCSRTLTDPLSQSVWNPLINGIIFPYLPCTAHFYHHNFTVYSFIRMQENTIRIKIYHRANSIQIPFTYIVTWWYWDYLQIFQETFICLFIYIYIYIYIYSIFIQLWIGCSIPKFSRAYVFSYNVHLSMLSTVNFMIMRYRYIYIHSRTVFLYARMRR